MAKDNTVRKSISLKTHPGIAISFKIDNDFRSPYSIAGGNNGIVNTKDNVITYTPNGEFAGTEVLVCNYKKDSNNIELTITIKVGYSFKANSHILSLLGDELIGSDNLAIFELVKNAYDADAKEVKIIFENLNTPEQAIIVEDDGSGMTLETLRDVWLEIGTDFKRGKKRKESNKYHRISLGEKGVGRLAIHKLGKHVTLETQPENSNKSYSLSLDWQSLMDEHEYIEDTLVEIKTINKSLFKERKGTRIIIKDLKNKFWERKDLRELAKKVNSIKSPFKNVKGKFDVIINANEYQGWIDDIKDVNDILTDSVYYFDFTVKASDKSEFASLSWNYNFTPPKSFGLNPTKISYPYGSKENSVFLIKPVDGLYAKDQKHLKNVDLEGIGEITGRFYVYNLLSVVLRSFGQSQVIKNFVKENCGVKIFRDGIRVYNYGEPNDDWLGLNLARVQRLGNHFSKNTTIGSIEIAQIGSSQGLKEKTNREGFDENPTFLKFRDICAQVFNLFESTAQKDRDLLGDYLDGLKPQRSVGLPETINELGELLKKQGVDKGISPLLKRIEKDYNSMRDVMLNSGMTGINLGVVFHEVEREIKFINKDLRNEKNIDSIKDRVKNLLQIIESFSPILKQNTSVVTSASQIVEKAKRINYSRFGFHKVIFSSPLLSKEADDFQIKGPVNLLISAISNLIDNAIYWVSSKKELHKDYKPAIYITSDVRSFEGPALVIADNGDGFALEPEDLIMPYRTTRPGGMGLGLYYVNMVMEMIGGKLLFPDIEDLIIPKVYNGAIIVLIFPKL